MTSQDTDKPYSNAGNGFRQSYNTHVKPRLGALGDRARTGTAKANAWAKARLPGGAPTLWIILGIVGLGLLIWALQPGDSASQRRGFGGMGGPMSVGALKAAKGSIPITQNALGTVTPLATVTVRPQVGGQIVSNTVPVQVSPAPLEPYPLEPRLCQHPPGPPAVAVDARRRAAGRRGAGRSAGAVGRRV